ncbi:hydroxychlorobactene glucosyltransferase CruC [soil metagenome]
MIFLFCHSFFWFVLTELRFRRNQRASSYLMKAPAQNPPRMPSVSVFVPARNEERYIERAIRSLLAQDYPGAFHIYCANDHSKDRTGEILRKLLKEFGNARLTVFNTPELPAGWMGKCHALYRAVALQPEKADIYLFTDADVVHRPDTIRRAVLNLHRAKVDLFAIMPYVHCVGFWENAILPILMHFGILILNPANLNNPRKREAVGIGAFTMIRRAMYEKWGGHDAIRGEIIDDMAMGVMTKRAGGRMAFVRAGRAVELRMYTDFDSISKGFEKNMHASIGAPFPIACLAAFGISLQHCTPAVVMLAALVLPVHHAVSLFVAALLVHIATGLVLYSRTSHFLGAKPLVLIVAYPIGAIAASTIMIRSAWHARFLKQVRWRGRTLPLPKQRTKMF